MGERVIMGVAGGSGSGKTTIVDLLREHYGDEGLLVINMDHYYRDLSHLSPAERDLRNFDHPDAFDMDLLAEHVGRLKAGEAVQRPTYDFKTHTRARETVTMRPQPAIVVDGILSLHDPVLRSHYTVSVFVDVEPDLRFIRRLKRDISERGRTLESVVDQYLRTVKPMHDMFVEPQRHHADVILSWKEYSEKAIKMLARSLA